MTRMRTRLTRRPLLWGAILAFAIVTCLPAVAIAEQGSLALYGIDVTQFPKATAKVGLPDSLIAGSSDTPTFTVSENGTSVEVLSAESKSGGAAVDAVLVIDVSGSMKGAPLANAKIAAHRFVNDLAGKARIAIIAFSSSPRIVSEYTSTTSSLNWAIDGLTAEGETASYDAIVQATRLARASKSSLSTIVLLSDGGDDSSTGTLDEAVKAAQAEAMPILAVALQSPDFNQRPLEIMASRSGGRLVSVADSAKLTDYFGSLAREVASVYEVTYRSARPTTKNIDLDIVATTPGGSAAASTTMENPLYVGQIPIGNQVFTVPTSNPWMLFGAVALAFASVGLLVSALLSATGRRSRLDQMRFYDQLHGELATPDDAAPSNNIRRKIIDAVGLVAGRGGFTQAIHAELERAGLPLRPAEYIAAHVLFVAIVGFLGQLLLGNLWMSLGVVLFASIVPLMYLSSRGRKRTRDFEAQLPDVLNLLSGGLRTGWGLQQAIDLVVTEGDKPASEEFRRVQIEARLGVPVESALETMADRLDSDVFRWVVSAVSIQREVGGNLAEVLDNVAKSVRDRDALYRQVSALTAEGRLSAMILTALPFIVGAGIFVVAPNYILTGLRSPLGIPLVLAALLLLVVGIVWLRAVSRIEY